MLCTTNSPPLASPIGSEISVGAPSPPPDHPTHLQHLQLQQQQQHLQQQQLQQHYNNHHHHHHRNHHHQGDDYFKPLKRLKGIQSRARSTSPLSRSSLEGVKSFSIADILGQHDDDTDASNNMPNMPQNNHHLNHHHAHHHQTTKIVRPWDHLRGPVPVRSFLPPALLHYEHRLALDYQRQLHEHLNAQAQLLRHMNMSMDIIPSESGSERSSSAASDCCSPEISSRLSADPNNSGGGGGGGGSSAASGGRQSSPAHAGGSSAGGASTTKTKPNGTPLDALFQMTNKSFEEAQGENGNNNNKE